MFLLLTYLTYFTLDSMDSAAEFEQIDAGLAWEIVVSDNKFVLYVVTVRNILTYGLGNLVGLYVFMFIYPI